VEDELLGVPDNLQRADLLQATHDYLSQRRADLGGSRKLFQIPLRPYDFFEDLGLPPDPELRGWSVREAAS
jgi:hypothetical protein